ncbi:MAG: SDR family oxidoreductase [Naasia sp.]
MTIVITGATGHLGRAAVAHLLERGAAASDVVAAGRDAGRLAELAATGVRTAVIDYADPSSLDSALEGAETVVLISGSEVGRRVEQHRNVVEAAARAGAKRIIYTSAPHATTSELILAPEHKATEELIAASGLASTILRNNWYNENYAATIAQVAQTGVYLASTGAGRVASASRDDYAEAIAAVVTSDGHEGAVYELAGDTAWDGEGFAAAAAEALGRPVVYQSVSPAAHADALRSAGLDDGTVGFLVGLDGNIRDGLLDGPSDVLSGLIGRPTTPLVATLRELAPTA